MDRMGAVESEEDGRDDRDMVDDRPPAIGSDERRMHVRAYNFWVSLLAGRAYPAIGDLDPADAGDFADHAVLLDFTHGESNPAITYLGSLLREACGIDGAVTTIADVPSRTLLDRLTDHYLQILANRAPIGFEAEFVDRRGVPTLYRGILMPFSSDDQHIDHVYGVINWKTLAGSADVDADALGTLGRHAPPAGATAWADGPGATHAVADDGARPLAAIFEDAVDAAAAAEIAWTDCRTATHRAIGAAHDLMLAAEASPDAYAALLADAGIRARSAPRAAIALVFGSSLATERADELSDALAGARRLGLPAGALPRHLEGLRGGLKALAAAERMRRAARRLVRARRELAARQHDIDLAGALGDAQFALLLAHRDDAGATAIVGRVADGSPLVADAIRAVAQAPRRAA